MAQYSDWLLRPALCLDLDGTVRYSASGEFINGPNDVRLYPDVEAKLWEFREGGFLIAGITNQGGVAFGHKNVETVDLELEATANLFSRNPFHTLKACMHHPDGDREPYNHRSLLRKPAYGMLAIVEVEAFNHGWTVDWDHSIFVGDRDEDKQCAVNASIEFIHANEFFGRSDRLDLGNPCGGCRAEAWHQENERVQQIIDGVAEHGGSTVGIPERLAALEANEPGPIAHTCGKPSR